VRNKYLIFQNFSAVLTRTYPWLCMRDC